MAALSGYLCLRAVYLFLPCLREHQSMLDIADLLRLRYGNTRCAPLPSYCLSILHWSQFHFIQSHLCIPQPHDTKQDGTCMRECVFLCITGPAPFHTYRDRSPAEPTRFLGKQDCLSFGGELLAWSFSSVDISDDPIACYPTFVAFDDFLLRCLKKQRLDAR